MSYTKNLFALELESFLSKPTIEYHNISAWAYETRLRNLPEIDEQISNWLLELGAMDMGPEFELSRDCMEDLVIFARQNKQSSLRLVREAPLNQ